VKTPPRLLSLLTLVPPLLLLVVGASFLFAGCAVSEEVRQIERVKNAKKEELEGRREELTGQQVFVRSCNTCHPAGKLGLGPALDRLNDHFPTDLQLASFIRKGKGQMPPQPKSVLTDKELANLISYLRATYANQTEATQEQQSSATQTKQ
jgi:mono/diheme cytochrome c family protein